MIDTSRRTSRRAPSRNDSVRSRSGSMLLLVLIIFAVGLILITSAMAITVSSRNRYYSASLDSQAGLTANSVAKTIANAIVAGDITDTQLEALTNSGKTVDITAATAATAAAGSAAGSNAIAPGLAGTSGSNTKATFSYYPDAATKTYILITVKTQLATASDNQSQTVSVLLKKKPVVKQGQFSSLMSTVKFDMVGASQINIGEGAGANATNFVVIKGNSVWSNLGGGGSTYRSKVLTFGQIAVSNDVSFLDDLVFYGNAASISTSSTGNGIVVTGGNMFFLGTDPAVASVFTDSSKAPTTFIKNGDNGSNIINLQALSGVGGAMYLANNTLQNAANTDGAIKVSSGIVVDNSSKAVFSASSANLILTSPSATASDKNGAKIYAASNESLAIVQTLRDKANQYSTATQVSRTIPTTTAAAFTEIGLGSVRAGSVVAADAGAVPLTQADLTSVGTRSFSGSAYVIDTTNANTRRLGPVSDYAGVTTLNFDCSSTDITIYIIGANTFEIHQGLIRFTRSSGSTHVGRIILLDGADLHIYDNSNFYTWRNDNGIIGADHVAGTAHTDLLVTKDGSGNVVKTFPPYLYIYGTDGNSITAENKSTIEGYIGLYGSGGTLTLQETPYFYGRLEVPNVIKTGASNEQLKILYCPVPGGDDSGGGTGSPSSYEIKGYINS